MFFLKFTRILNNFINFFWEKQSRAYEYLHYSYSKHFVHSFYHFAYICPVTAATGIFD